MAHQGPAVLGIAVVAMSEELGTAMAHRALEHLLQYGEPPVRSVAVPITSIIYPSVRWLRIQRVGIFDCPRGFQRVWLAHALVPAHGQAPPGLSRPGHAQNLRLCSGKPAEQHHDFLAGFTQKPDLNVQFNSWAPSRLLRTPNHVLDKPENLAAS